MKKKVLGIGEIVLDKVHQISNFPDEGEKIEASSSILSLGGPVPIALILLSRLGMECTLVASVAHDEAGNMLSTILAKEHVHFIKRMKSHTCVNTVLVNKDTGARTIIKDIQIKDGLKTVPKELVQSADCIMCDRHEPTAVSEVIKNKRQETHIIMDPSTDYSPTTLELLKKMDVPIIPVETLSLLFPREKIQSSAKKLSLFLKKKIVVTIGKYGSAISDGKQFTVCPPVPITSVDSLGAGDVFRGGFACGLLNGWDIYSCTHFANVVAGLQCTKVGNSTAIPTKKEIINFQKSSVHLSNLMSLI